MIQLSPESLNYIHKFTSKMDVKDSKYYKQLFQYFNSYYSSEVPTHTLTEHSVSINLPDNRFISTNIRKSIHRLQKYHIVKSNRVTMHIYHNDDITHFIRIALTYINFMYNLSGSTKRLTITYYLTDNKKVRRNRILTPDEVNTGSTDSFGVTIWRKEEVYKTTIHELIHFFKLDYRDDKKITEYYRHKYNCISETINSFEAYVDFWAILINSFLCTKLLKNPYMFFVNCLNLEKTFVEYQSHKIIKLDRDYNRYTNVLPYYIIKAELFRDLPKTLKVLECRMGLTDKYFEYLRGLHKIVPKKRFTDPTLRMSIVEIV